MQSSADGATGEKKGGPKREAKLVAKIAALQAELAQIRAQHASAAAVTTSPAAASTPLAEAAADTRPPAPQTGQPAEAGAQIHASWPLLASGCEDIAAMRFLHVALSAAGYYCGEVDEMEWLFGEGTLNALLTFQACSGVTETGVTDAATWKALLGDVACAAVAPFSTASGPVSDSAGAVATAGPAAEAAPVADATLRRKRKAAKGVQRAALASADADGDADTEGWAADAGSASDAAVADAAALAAPLATRWPVLRREDGDVRVGALQKLLGEAGFSCGDDDVRFWFFGDATDAALRTFQACAPGVALPETGVTDAATWRALLGARRFAAGPAALAALVDASDDMVDREGVFLLGEDRWEVPMPERASKDKGGKQRS